MLLYIYIIREKSCRLYRRQNLRKIEKNDPLSFEIFEKMEVDRAHTEEAETQHHQTSPTVEPSGKVWKRKTKNYLEEILYC